MITVRLYKKIIKDMRGSLITYQKEKILVDFNLPKTKDSDGIITSPENTARTRISELSEYPKLFEDLYKKRNFLAQLFDGSLLQGYYRVLQTDNALLEGSLVFYPNPSKLNPDYFEDEPQILSSSDTKKSTQSLLQYIRIDFNRPDYKEIFHPAAHIHIGINSNTRIAINRFPFFSEFVLFILFIQDNERWLQMACGPKNTINTANFSSYLQDRKRNINFIDSILSPCEKLHYTLNM